MLLSPPDQTANQHGSRVIYYDGRLLINPKILIYATPFFSVVNGSEPQFFREQRRYFSGGNP
jgi:hypothetical protein